MKIDDIKSMSKEDRKKALVALREKADAYELDYPANISLEKMIGVIDSHEVGSEDEKEEVSNGARKIDDVNTYMSKELSQYPVEGLTVKKAITRLIHVIVSNNDPADSISSSDRIAIYNSVEGKIADRVVPFDVPTNIEYAVYAELKNRKFNMRKKVKRELPNGETINKLELVPRRKFNIEVLDPMTNNEIGSIAKKQLSETL